MHRTILALLLSIPFMSFAESVGVYVFDRTIYLPHSCKLAVSASVKGETVRYICGELNGTWISFSKNTPDMIESFEKNEDSTVENLGKLDDLNWYRFKIHHSNSEPTSVEVICDKEICVAINSENKTEINGLLSQLDR